jgi:hypothetical protein
LIQRAAIHGFVPFGTDEIELLVITKGAKNWKFVLHSHSKIKTVHHMVSLIPNMNFKYRVFLIDSKICSFFVCFFAQDNFWTNSGHGNYETM